MAIVTAIEGGTNHHYWFFQILRLGKMTSNAKVRAHTHLQNGWISKLTTIGHRQSCQVDKLSFATEYIPSWIVEQSCSMSLCRLRTPSSLCDLDISDWELQSCTWPRNSSPDHCRMHHSPDICRECQMTHRPLCASHSPLQRSTCNRTRIKKYE